MSPEALKLGADLIQRRDEMRRLLGIRYTPDVLVARNVLRGVERESGQPLAKAALMIAQEMDRAGVDPGLIIAALVDEAEERGE